MRVRTIVIAPDTVAANESNSSHKRKGGNLTNIASEAFSSIQAPSHADAIMSLVNINVVVA
jgi:hypothetical protein